MTSNQNTQSKNSSITADTFGVFEDAEVMLFTLKNNNNVQVSITNFGGAITKALVPDRKGKLGDVVLGFETLEKYVHGSNYFGALIGRYGNRIANGRFSINGENYQVTVNDGTNHLHGGGKGLHKVLWDAEPAELNSTPTLKLRYRCADGEEGYPGNLNITVEYSLTEQNELIINYFAESDKNTLCNLTNHAYFNLADGGRSSILNHVLKINSNRITPVNEQLIPTGEFREVDETPFDFRKPIRIGSKIEERNVQLLIGSGYDHNFVINGRTGELRSAAKAFAPSSGRVLEVLTEEPGMQFYSGNFLDGTDIGIGGIQYNHRSGFCLETQHFPDSPNQPHFPSTILRAGEKYNTKTIYKFSVRD